MTRSSLSQIQNARKNFRLESLQWSMTPPRSVLPGSRVCEDEDFIDFVLDLCSAPLSEFIALVRHARSPLVPVDRVNKRLASGRASTWEAFAKDFWRAMLFDMIVHMKAASDRQLCAEIMKDLIERPIRASERRSWPSMKTFRALKEEWRQLAVNERVRMTVMSSSEYWFVQSCGLATTVSNLKYLKKSGIEPSEDSMRLQLELQGQIVANLRVEVGSELYLMMNDEFVQRNDSLDLIFQKAVTSIVEKEEILRLVYCCRFESIFENDHLAQDFHAESSWTQVERLVATLLLDHLISRLSHTQAIRRCKAEVEDATSFSLAQRKIEESRKKRLKAKMKKVAARESGASLATPPTQPGEESDSSEKETADGWKAEIRAFLQEAPSWDISCVRVVRTFIELNEGVAELPRYSRDI